MNGPLIFQIMAAVLAANAITLLGIYSIAKMNKTELREGTAATRYIVMLLITAALAAAVSLLAQG